jgi:geranylgeranyl pyrophosphate synthase
VKRSPASAPEETLPEAFERLRAVVEDRLPGHLARGEADDPIAAAVEAAVLSPGKRIRPVLTLLVAEALGGSAGRAADAACVIELVHAASLVLDDLPCMDDADLRRGRPTLHRRFGEAVAVLAAFALLARAQARLTAGLAAAGVAPAYRTTLEQRLAAAVDAMCRGQALDLALDGKAADLAMLESVHARKTGALFEIAAELGAVLAGARGSDVEAVLAYARNLGLAFQVGDDLLDVEGRPETLGKPTGQDSAHGRATFVSVLGSDGARAIRDDLIATATAAVAPLGVRGRLLREFAEYVRVRRA